MASDDEDEEDIGMGAALSERRSMYPDEGYALVVIDMFEPPGQALAKIGEYDSLEEITMPSAGEMTEYVVYDSDGNSYDREDL